MHKYHPDMEPLFGDTCPPQAAQPVDREVFRGVKSPVISANDFVSHAEGRLPNHDRTNCEHWGLSVWTSDAAVEHARKTFRVMRRWYIAKGKVTGADGVLLATPSGAQPEHHTFWKLFNHDIHDAFEVVLNPANSK
jgi:hypothetical protein